MTGQQTWIAVGVLIGFIVFITVRGELPAYLTIFQTAGGPAAVTQSKGAAAGEQAAIVTLLSNFGKLI